MDEDKPVTPIVHENSQKEPAQKESVHDEPEKKPHVTHHKPHTQPKDETFTVKKTTLWQGISSVLGILLAVSIFTGGYGFGGDEVTSGQAAVANPTPKKSKKKTIYALAAVAVIVIIGYFMFFNSDSGEKPLFVPGDDISVNLEEVPKSPIHWHPTLTVIINGDEQTIPSNLGGRAGSHLPIHTHDRTGVLHMEDSTPSASTVTTGYFFDKILRKTFNSNCIYDSCNGPEGSMTMTVNGQRNFMFDKYVMKDKDSIVIEFSDTPAAPKTETKEFSMTAKQWEFIPNTITVNKGDTVKLSIRSIDVSHGIALPEFGVSEFLRPGITTDLEFVADKTGTYSFYCSVQCGAGHGSMRGTLIVN